MDWVTLVIKIQVDIIYSLGVETIQDCQPMNKGPHRDYLIVSCLSRPAQLCPNKIRANIFGAFLYNATLNSHQTVMADHGLPN